MVAALFRFLGGLLATLLNLSLGMANGVEEGRASSPASIPVPSLEVALRVAREAALEAGKHIRAACLQRSEVKFTKSNDVDLVTETDQLCEKVVIDLLKSHFPDHAIIGEESSGSSRYALTDAPTWTIDPIDGTTNFVHGLALTCVLIAFLHRKEVQVGVIYDPNAEELFWATRGGGAFMRLGPDGPPTKISVSSTTSLKQAVISMDPGYGRDAAAVARFQAVQGLLLTSGIRNIRVVGSTGLNMAYVACGRLDAGFEEGAWETNCGPKIWDFAPGSLIIAEAGGLCRDIGVGSFLTGPLDLLGRSFFVASTPALASELLTRFGEGRTSLLKKRLHNMRKKPSATKTPARTPAIKTKAAAMKKAIKKTAKRAATKAAMKAAPRRRSMR